MYSHAVVENGTIVAEYKGDAVVPWWSVGKTVLAAAALALVRDGRLALDAPVSGQAFTLRQLLQHRAGLSNYGPLPEYKAAVARGDEGCAADCGAVRPEWRGRGGGAGTRRTLH